MDKKKRIITLIVAMAMFCMMSMSVLAVTNKVVILPKNQTWTPRYSLTRPSTNYSYVYARCDSVYPVDGSSDNFKKIQTRIVDFSGDLIMTKEHEVLNEGNTNTKLQIKEGKLSVNPVFIQFRGNTNEAAEAVVNYWGP